MFEQSQFLFLLGKFGKLFLDRIAGGDEGFFEVQNWGIRSGIVILVTRAGGEREGKIFLRGFVLLPEITGFNDCLTLRWIVFKQIFAGDRITRAQLFNFNFSNFSICR